MIDKKVNAEEQVQRMKNLMNYGLKENKQPAYSSVEYSKTAADGKLYGIVREGANYYIKVAKNAKGNIVAENFDYIGGFRNRKDNMFESFASAERYFCEKMQCINESIDDKQKRVIAESWDLEAKKEVIEEGTKKMQAEIARQRQIMMNAQKINEGKSQCCDMEDCPKCDTLKTEEPASEPGAPFTQKLTNADVKDNEKTNIKGKTEPMVGNKKATNESAETPLVSRKNPDYMDTTHGTEIGNSAPFVDSVEDKPEGAVADAPGGEEEKPEMESVNEEVAMYDTDNQNSPKPGVGEKGDNAPFEDKAEITEDVEDLDDEIEDDEDIDDLDFDDEQPTDIDAEAEGEEIIGSENENEPMDIEDVEDEVEVEAPANDTEARLDAMEAKLNQILDALNNLKYEDEPLYDDDEDELDNTDTEEEGPVEAPEEEEVEDEVEVVESKSYKEMKSKKAIKEESDFGKHPAFQKVVMTTPETNMPEKDGQYDMNDESTEENKPYATEKGSQAPYDKTPEDIEGAITEAVLRFLKKKLV